MCWFTYKLLQILHISGSPLSISLDPNTIELSSSSNSANHLNVLFILGYNTNLAITIKNIT